MNRKTKTRQLQQQLADALDGQLSDDAVQRLKMEVNAHEPDLWKDYLWMMEQQKANGVFSELAGMRNDKPGKDAIKQVYARIASQRGTGAELEEIVWSWFRRYVLTFCIILIVFLAGMQTGGSDNQPPDSMESFLGLHTEELPVLDHWLYEDFNNQ